MLNSVQNKLNKGFIKTKDLQQKIFELRKDDPEIKPVDAAHALLAWFQEPDNEFIRLDVLKYAISHMWSTVGAKIDEDAVRSVVTSKKAAASAKPVAAPTPAQKAHVAKLVSRVQAVSAVSQKRKQQVAEAADKAVEQIVSTLKLMTFKQARMLYGAMADLDLTRGSDDQLLGDVFTDAEIRSAVG